MRLLHSTLLKLEEFIDTSNVPYAILSHTWGDGEVSFQDMQNGDGQNKAGYNKILGCCKIAAADGFEYVWIDTCCIDKTSSSELSEAINSMYQWYQDADVCYAYLADIHAAYKEEEVTAATLSMSRWFTRGWTFQELIAPSTVIFFNADWQDIGTKHSLLTVLSEVTRVHSEALIEAKLDNFSVAQKMSWASKRQTTRVEDIAYCLMGIFEINMPMLYGEGGRAFLRLQEEIMKKSDDHSIFSWELPDACDMGDVYSGLFATSPGGFYGCNEVVRHEYFDAPPFAITNKGVHLQLPLIERPDWPHPIHVALLNCKYAHKPDKLLGIWIFQHNSRFYRDHHYVGLDDDGNYGYLPSIPMSTLEKRLPLTSIYAHQIVENRVHMITQPPLLIDIRGLDEVAHVSETFPPEWFETLQTPLLADADYATDILSFTCNNDSEDQFFVAVQWTSRIRAASVGVGVRDLGDTLPEILKGLHYVSRSGGGFLGTDRLTWQHPCQLWYLKIAIKRRAENGARMYILQIEKCN